MYILPQNLLCTSNVFTTDNKYIHKICFCGHITRVCKSIYYKSTGYWEGNWAEQLLSAYLQRLGSLHLYILEGISWHTVSNLFSNSNFKLHAFSTDTVHVNHAMVNKCYLMWFLTPHMDVSVINKWFICVNIQNHCQKCRSLWPNQTMQPLPDFITQLYIFSH